MTPAETAQRSASNPASGELSAAWVERVGADGPGDRLWQTLTSRAPVDIRTACIELEVGIVAIAVREDELSIGLAPPAAAWRLVLYAVERTAAGSAPPPVLEESASSDSGAQYSGAIRLRTTNREDLCFSAADLPASGYAAGAILAGCLPPVSPAADHWTGVARARRRGRRDQTESLNARGGAFLRALIGAASRTRLAASVTPQTFELSRDDGGAALASGQAEFEDGPRFFSLLGEGTSAELLRNRTVLDLGCGFGGRTVYYARHCAARRVEGIEITPSIVERCNALARRLGADNVSFQVGQAENLPYDDESFDTVISFDVLEHVDDPVRAFAEIARVLRPGGDAWLVFPTYLGARSSHLDYLTKLPMLHRLFDPDSIVAVVNGCLADEPSRYGVSLQPPPRVGVLGRRTLPTLNGLTLREARRLAAGAGLQVTNETLTPVVTAGLPLPLAGLIARPLEMLARRSTLPELLVGNIALALRKP